MSIIAPTITDDNQYFFFDATTSSTTYYEMYQLGTDTQSSQSSVSGTVFSFQPAFYNNKAYFHINSEIYYREPTSSVLYSLYDSDSIDYDTNNLNSTIAVSTKNDILFVCGYYLCGLQLNSLGSSVTLLWCNQLNGGSTQGVTPSIDDESDLVFIYDNGYILAYDQIKGTLMYTFGNGDVKNECNLGNMGCLSSQAIITPLNVIWGDGNSVIIFDRKYRDSVLTLQDICDNTQSLVGNSIGWYNEYLIVSCPNKIIGYRFN